MKNNVKICSEKQNVNLFMIVINSTNPTYSWNSKEHCKMMYFLISEKSNLHFKQIFSSCCYNNSIPLKCSTLAVFLPLTISAQFLVQTLIVPEIVSNKQPLN